MSTISENLLALAQVKQDIADAIIAQGVAVSPTDTFASYAVKIGQITGSGANLPQNVFCSRIVGTEVVPE